MSPTPIMRHSRDKTLGKLRREAETKKSAAITDSDAPLEERIAVSRRNTRQIESMMRAPKDWVDNSRYKLTGYFTSVYIEGRGDVAVFQIVATSDFKVNGTSVKAGEVGGYIEKIANLPVEGVGWVGPNTAIVGDQVLERGILTAEKDVNGTKIAITHRIAYSNDLVGYEVIRLKTHNDLIAVLRDKPVEVQKASA